MLQITDPTKSDINKLNFLLKDILRVHGIDKGINIIRDCIAISPSNNPLIAGASKFSARFIVLYGHEAFNKACKDMMNDKSEVA